ncbi:response regulator transcription factor [Actinomadura macrotermitis]
MSGTTVLLAEDVHMIRGALVALLELEPDLRVVADVERGEDVLPAALEHRPDVAVLDIDLPGVDGLAAAVQLHAALPACRTLMLTSLGRPGTLRRALAAGVHGYILKDAPPEELARAVRAVASGRRVIDPQLAATAWEAGPNPLTPRERELLALTAEGAHAREIAERLRLGLGTVRNHLANATAKTGGRNRIDAIRIARDNGWL